MTGHTADDQAETVVLRLLRGAGSTGLSAIAPGPTHPLLALRRAETAAVCDLLGIDTVHDSSNDHLDVWRNRVRAEVMPVLADIADRDPTPILTRTADLLRQESALLERARRVDRSDRRPGTHRGVTRARPAGTPAVARRRPAMPPDAASIDRVMAVAQGDAVACELPGGRRVERSHQRLRVVEPRNSDTDAVEA